LSPRANTGSNGLLSTLKKVDVSAVLGLRLQIIDGDPVDGEGMGHLHRRVAAGAPSAVLFGLIWAS
jgi:hypothetical protein